eukprot:CAMPEP_0179634016 /NCGR_PEP_ID=MMETSP0932-20121108/7806_1 /TAXON_ID=548131 ORGANISM="Ostreococcus mediterraneus, Strain clade-D-RCC2596" /NCGR_SAMPLE_ID=MMETSP0932 /ASSEMBLY_ACC=CAM_ASM_000582 /LENGTH=38 /DNA_ID= /DNA_START= /DNA_END= /DNA_ORIENTATION=
MCVTAGFTGAARVTVPRKLTTRPTTLLRIDAKRKRLSV